MTGPEHYQEAENRLKDALAFHNQGEAARAQYHMGVAQVHATLALAAATALGQGTETDRTNWRLAMRDNDVAQAQEYLKARADHIAAQY